MSAFDPLRTLPLAIVPAEAEPLTIANKARALAVLPQVEVPLLAALLIVIGAPSNQPSHLFICEDHIVSFLNEHSELLAQWDY